MWSTVTGFFSLCSVFKVHPCGSLYQQFISFNCQIIFYCVDISLKKIHQLDIWVNILVIMNNAPIKICVDYVFISLGCISRRGIARSHGNSMFNHLRDCQTFFLKWPWHFTYLPALYSGFQILHQHLLFSVFLIAILVGVKSYLILVLICTSLMAKHVEHLVI